MIGYDDLPALNAVLNGTSAVLLLMGYASIRRRNIPRHRSLMIAAFVVSILFLASYLTYHAHAGTTRFAGTGASRPVYFSILLTHTVLAGILPILAIVTLVLGLKGRYARHRRVARITFPVWLYVSVTGVVIYLMLYQIYKVPRV